MHRLHDRAASPPGLRITLPAEDHSLAVLRHVVRGFRDAYGLAPARMDDIVLAVSEAAANSARHAYDDEPPETFTVLARVDGELLHVTVSDHGRGIAPPASIPRPGHGLSLMAHVSLSLEVLSGPAGTTILMSFDISDDPADSAFAGFRGAS